MSIRFVMLTVNADKHFLSFFCVVFSCDWVQLGRSCCRI